MRASKTMRIPSVADNHSPWRRLAGNTPADMPGTRRTGVGWAVRFRLDRELPAQPQRYAP